MIKASLVQDQPLGRDTFELLVQGVFDYAIFLLDPEGHVMTWNPGAERIKEYKAEEIIGAHFSRFYTEEDRQSGVPAKALGTAAETGRFMAEGWRVRKDGTRFWAMVVIDRIQQDGQIVGFAKITRDITEQWRAQQAAIESERRFRHLVEGVTDYAIYMLSPEGHVTNWNAGAQRIKGYNASEIVGKHFSSFYVPEDAIAGLPVKALETARRDGRYEAEGWRVRKDGSRFWANAVIDAIYDDNRQLIGFAKITRDLTERRQTQIELEQSREQLAHAQKMEAIGHLTGGLAHDFNNLLTGILGSLELLKVRARQGKYNDVERLASVAEGAASRASAVTHRLLAFARRQTLDPKPTEANRLVLGMEDLIRRSVGPAITTKSVMGAGLWLTLCDTSQLESAILNLAINARDAMPHGGQLTIETTNTWIDDRGAKLLDLQPGQFVAISVSDTGIGMTPEVAGRAFDPFFTTKPLGAGTGLGLSMVYGFVKQSGGHARIYSEVGKGTTVRIYLPRFVGDAEENTATAPSEEPPAVSADETVLVVEDDPAVRMLVLEVLGEMGYACLEAGSGKSALKILQSAARLDLMITDVGLPEGMNGRQLADAARETRPDLKILFITGYAENAALSDGHIPPGMHVLTKPFALEALSSRVTAILKS